MRIPVDDPADHRVGDYVGLTDVVLRSRHEPGAGVFIAESAEVLRRAVAAGCAPRSFLLDPARLAEVADVVEAFPDVPTYLAGQDVLRRLTGFRVHRGILAAMRRPPERGTADLLATVPPGRARLVVLEDLVDHTNVGAAFRSVAGLGADGVLVSPRCADPLYRRSVRVSMGTVFAVPWARAGQWPDAVGDLRAAGFVVAALTLAPTAVPLEHFAAAAPDRVAIVLGAEGDGLAATTVAACDVTVRIPMAGGVDSLNVAAACAVTLWALRGGDRAARSPTGPTPSPPGGGRSGRPAARS